MPIRATERQPFLRDRVGRRIPATPIVAAIVCLLLALFAGAIGTSNALITPSHQVNALVIGPGGYRVADFMRPWSVMTVLFVAAMLVQMNQSY